MFTATTTFEGILSQLEAGRREPNAVITETSVFVPELSELKLGQQSEVFSELIIEARDACSWLYQELREKYPENTKKELNALEPLATLNAVRRALVTARQPLLREIRATSDAKKGRSRRLEQLRTLASFDD